MGIRQLVTAEELWQMSEIPGKRFELVKGELVEVPGTGALHNFIVAVLFRLIDAFVRPRRLGIVATDGASFLLARHPDVVRIPDVSFVARGRVPEGGIPEGYWPFAPDLAVEIVSPGDRAADLREKVREYLDAGTRLVWVVWPRDRSVTVYAAGGEVRELREGDELDGGAVLPGFRARVADLFAVEY